MEPEDAFIEDFIEWYESKYTNHTGIIFMLDANEQWTQNSKIKDLAQRLRLCNVNIDGGYNFPVTHPCISNPTRDTTIDYCLCTTKVLHHIQFATMAPYDLSCLGNHRGLIIDLDLNMMLSVQDESTKTSVGRKLATNNPEVTKRYLDKVNELFKNQNIYRRTETLFHQWLQRKWSKWDVMKKYEKLDTEIFHICRKAEKQSKPSVSGRHKWSPKLACAIKQLSYWKARMKYGSNNRVVIQLGQEADIDYEYKSTNEIQQMINVSR